MMLKKMLIALISGLLFAPVPFAVAGDFDWTQHLNINARADLSNFKAGLATRFRIGDAEIEAVLRDVANPADAYLVFRLGEMCSQPTEHVLQRYREDKNKGWGAIAKSLGIKPGSKEFHALKKGPDIEYVSEHHHGDSKHKKNKKNKGKG